VATECADERLKSYNGSCYLFITYPEVDWLTAQQVCRGIDGQLASISTADEQRFVTANIRNHADYSPRSFYWLGGEVSAKFGFEWTDGSSMAFQGWLPGQEPELRSIKNPTCLGLQWKTSPTPMLQSGLYWTVQKCGTFGGYVCKTKRRDSSNTLSQNQTLTGSEGRFVSPGNWMR
jgi:Lectin C-type domain